MVQVGLQVPTPRAVRKGLFSCEFLARLQELCLAGSLCLLSAGTVSRPNKAWEVLTYRWFYYWFIFVHYLAEPEFALACMYVCIHINP